MKFLLLDQYYLYVVFPFVRLFGPECSRLSGLVYSRLSGKTYLNHRLLWKSEDEAAEWPQEPQPLSQVLDYPTRTTLTGQPRGQTRSLFHETQL